MPANLTHQYLKAEEAYRGATGPVEELQCLQEMLRELPKHKGTDKLQAELKQKISISKKEIQSQPAGKKGHRLRIPRQGAGRVVVIGGPNAGKSQFVATVTRATPEIADFPFTTRNPTPAMMPWQDVLVQMIDTPPITRHLMEPYMQGLVRGADLALLVLDLGSDEGLQDARDVFDRFAETKTKLARITCLDEQDIGLALTRTFLVANKRDLPDAELRWELFCDEFTFDFETFLISALNEPECDELKKSIYESLDVVRVYTKLPTAKEPDLERPYTVRRGSTVADVAVQVHKDFANNLKFARVWGSQVHDATVVKSDYVVNDRDIVELHA